MKVERTIQIRWRLLTGVVLLLAAAAVWAIVLSTAQAVASEPPKGLIQLLKANSSPLQGMDVARLNLLCAEGLPGAENLVVERLLKTLDDWANQVRVATLRNLYRFQHRPEEYERSEAYFRMLVMITVLQRDLGLRYNPGRIAAPTAADLNSGEFFSDSKDLFLHGLLGERRMGTCASMPVLYVAVGRRLGYPLHLVRGKSHLFVRWETSDGKERLNIEGSARGLVTHPDEHYKSWPFPIEEKEILDGQYLKNLTAAEEVAEFLVNRACCLARNGRASEAREAMIHASRLAPKIQRYAAVVGAENPSAK
ncbi:MAG: hypothetical protein HZA91_12440 [Verrucomicrobia bacterium]|nr:hypothetical protein [Verrucomicrobiota bacterium]